MELRLKNVTSYNKKNFTNLDLAKKSIYYTGKTVVENPQSQISFIIPTTKILKNANALY